MKRYRIHPNVISCGAIRQVLTDKSISYPENFWKAGEAEEKVREGYLVVDTESIAASSKPSESEEEKDQDDNSDQTDDNGSDDTKTSKSNKKK